MTYWYGSIIHAPMTELYPVSHELSNPVGRSVHNQCQFYNRRVQNKAIKVCIQLDEVLSLYKPEHSISTVKQKHHMQGILEYYYSMGN